MLFKRYEEVILRLEELGARMGKLSNNERQELQSLLEEQAWLGLTLVKKARSVMEEIDKNFEVLFDWMVLSTDLIDRAAEQGGRPDDVLRLKKVILEAGGLKEQLKRLSINNNAKREGLKAEQEEDASVSSTETDIPPVLKTVYEAAAAAEPLEVEPPETKKTTVPVPVQPIKVKKVRKKKEKNKLKKNPYNPPMELLTAISQKVAPAAKSYVNLSEINPVSVKKPNPSHKG